MFLGSGRAVTSESRTPLVTVTLRS